jgi:tetratricopeptide (TPR) repeat protein
LYEWLTQSEDQIFLVTGEPGSGKSAFIAWLYGTGLLPADAKARRELEHVRSLVRAGHFCDAASGNIAPKAFAQHVAEQLSRRVPGFGDALAVSLEDRVQFSVRQEIGRSEGNTKITGVHIEHLDLGALGEEYSFNLVFREPLIKLYKDGYDEPLLVLVDALDEAATYTGQVKVDELLARLKDLPSRVRLLITTRPDPRVVRYYPDYQKVDLIEDAPRDADDVRQEVFERLRGFDEARRNILSDRISKSAEGNFLYAHLVVDDLLRWRGDGGDLENLSLPEKLSGLYRTFLNRELARDEGRWFETFEPVLGLIAVSFGAGLTARQIESIVGKRVRHELRVCKQYLDGELPEGPFSLFHKSFSDFLLRDEKNFDYHVEAGEMHRRIVGYYRGGAAATWERMDDYGWRHLTAHALGAKEGPGFQTLFEICDEGFLAAKHESVRGMAALEEDWARVFQACREADDFLRLVRYGVERSRQFTSVMYLQSTQLARVAVRLAVAGGSEAEVARLVEDINLVPHPHARLAARLAMLQHLNSEMPTHPAVGTLSADIDEAVAGWEFDEGDSHYLADYLSSVAAQRRAGWLAVCEARLQEVKGLPERVSVLAAMSRGLVAEADTSEAAWPLHEALIECGRLNLSDDFVKSAVGFVLSTGGQYQTRMMGQALRIILEAAPLLTASDCEEVVLRARDLFKQMGHNMLFMGEEENLERLRLENLAVEALSRAGLRPTAERIAREVMETYLKEEKPSATLLPLLPLFKKFGGAGDVESWRRVMADTVDEIISDRPLQLSFLLKEFRSQTYMVDALPELLELTSGRAAAQREAGENPGAGTLLAYAYALLGKKEDARQLLKATLDDLDAGCKVRAGRSEGTPPARYALLALWDIACAIGEKDLLGETLDRIITQASLSLGRDQRVSLWITACESLNAVSDLGLRRALFDRLKRLATHVVDTQAFLATALRQFADAYAALNRRDEIPRLLAESLRLQYAALSGDDLVNSLADTARLYNVIGDWQTSADLLRQALDIVIGMEWEPGSDFGKVDCLQTVLPVVADLARLKDRGLERAAPLLAQAASIVEGLEMAETAVSGAAALVRETHDLGFGEAVELLKRIYQREDAFENLNYRPPSSVGALSILLEAGEERVVRELLPRAEKTLKKVADSREHYSRDHDRAFACDGFAEMVRLYDRLAMPEKVEEWYGETLSLARSIKDPLYRCDAYLNLAEVAGHLGHADEAGESLLNAISEWRQVGASGPGLTRVPGIMSAWEGIADADARYQQVSSLKTVLGRLPDLGQREYWQAYIAASFLNDPERFKELSAPLTSLPGLDALLLSIRRTDAGPPDMVRRATFEILAKSSRLPIGVFAGHSLGAAQTLIRRGILKEPSALPVLISLEATIRSTMTL